MVRFGKLDSVDEGEDRVEKILRPVATKKKKTTVIVLTSSDEDEDEEEEADEAGAPLGPGKRQQPGLVRLNPLPQIRHPTVMAPTPLHGESTVGIGFSRTFLTSRDGQDSSASRAGNTGGDTQVPEGARHSGRRHDPNTRLSDDDSIYEISPPVQTCTSKASRNNPPSKNTEPLSNALARSAKPQPNLLRLMPSTSLPPFRSLPTPVSLAAAEKSKAVPAIMQASRRSQKYAPSHSLDITSTSRNPSRRIEPSPPRNTLSRASPLLPTDAHLATTNASSTLTGPVRNLRRTYTTQRQIPPTSPSKPAGSRLVLCFKRPPRPNPSTTSVQSFPPATSSRSTHAVPTSSPVEMIGSRSSINTVQSTRSPTKDGGRKAAQRRAMRPAKDLEHESDWDAFEEEPITRPVLHRSIYAIRDKFEADLYRSVGVQWTPLAQAREAVANGYAITDTDDASETVSGYDGDEEHPLPLGHRGAEAKHVCSRVIMDGQKCCQSERCLSVQRQWGPAEENRTEKEGARAGTPNALITAQNRTYTLQENVSVAGAMRRYVERFWRPGSTAEKPAANASSGQPEEGAEPMEEIQNEEPLDLGGSKTERLDKDVPILVVDSDDGSATSRCGSFELPSPTSTVKKLPEAAASVAVVSSSEPESSPPEVDTPMTDLSTAATLVNDPTVGPKNASSPGLSSAPLESTSEVAVVVASPVPVQSLSGADEVSLNESNRIPYDFSYESDAMHIPPSTWGDDSFVLLRPIDSTPKSSTQTNLPKSFKLLFTANQPSYRVTRHFLGVVPPMFPGTRGYCVQDGKVMREPDSTEKEEEGDQPRSEVEDWSESEMTPDALASYRACLFYQAQQERFEINETPRKRKAVDSASSSEYEGADFGEHHTVARGKGPMAMVMATTRPRKRMNMSQSPRMGRLGQNLHLPVRVFARGVAVEVPFGLCVDKIDPLTIEVRPVKDSIVSTTALCHNCRCNSTGLNRRAQCDNVTIGNSTRRCNKTFCERCLRGWYGLDDDAIEFVMRVQRAGEGRERTETCTGTGVGMGIVEGKWICPFCIDLCMCTHCYRRRGVERTKYAPSARAVISGNAVEQRVRATSSPVIRQRVTQENPVAVGFSTSVKAAAPATSRQLNSLAVPAHWLPLVPTPTPGLDPIYYQATRPCTRDFPTGAPQPTAANHAPILYHPRVELENDGLEDCFTGSEMGEDEPDGEDASTDSTPRTSSVPRVDRRREDKDKGETSAGQVVRKNFLIVKPGRKMPSTTKKRHLPALPPQVTNLNSGSDSGAAIDGVDSSPLRTPTMTQPNLVATESYSATIDPMNIFGAVSAPTASEDELMQTEPIKIDLIQARVPRVIDSPSTSAQESSRADSVSVNLSPNPHFLYPTIDVEMAGSDLGYVGPSDGVVDSFLCFNNLSLDMVDPLMDSSLPPNTDGDFAMQDEFLSLLLDPNPTHVEPGGSSSQQHSTPSASITIDDTSPSLFVPDPTTTMNAASGGDELPPADPQEPTSSSTDIQVSST